MSAEPQKFSLSKTVKIYHYPGERQLKAGAFPYSNTTTQKSIHLLLPQGVVPFLSLSRDKSIKRAFELKHVRIMDYRSLQLLRQTQKCQ